MTRLVLTGLFVCVIFGAGGCSYLASSRPGSADECDPPGEDWVELRGKEKAQLTEELVQSIESAVAMKLSFEQEYKHRLFRSRDDELLLCQHGPCLPVHWNFEFQGDQWVLLNRPEGLCVM